MAMTLDTTEMTSQPARAVHAGVNSVAITYTHTGNISGTCTLRICKLPRGSRMVGGTFRYRAAGEGDAADKLVIKDNEGNVYMDTAVAATMSAGATFLGTGLGNRITGSAHLYAYGFFKADGTGTSAPVMQFMPLYLADDEGD